MTKFKITGVKTEHIRNSVEMFQYFQVKNSAGDLLYIDPFVGTEPEDLEEISDYPQDVNGEEFLLWAKSQIGKTLEIEEVYAYTYLTGGKVTISGEPK